MSEVRVANVVFDAMLGGPQRRIVNTAAELRPSGIETVLVLPAGGAESERFAHAADIRTHAFEMQTPSGLLNPAGLIRYAVGALRDVRRFRRLFNDLAVDLVHVNGAFFVGPALAARWAGCALVWHLNDTVLPRPVARGLGRVVRSLADEVIAAAGAVADYYGIDDSTVVHAPVDTERFRPRPQLADGPPVLGILGNWAPVKGYDRFVRVLAGVKETTDVRAIAIGGYPAGQEEYRADVLAAAHELGVFDVLDDVGFEASPERFVASMDLLLLTSTSEASPTCVLEAMACGVPVVAFEVGGVREMLDARSAEDGACGAVVEEGDVDAMIDAVLRLLGDEATRREMADVAVERARAEFSTGACANRHSQVYRTALKENRT